MKRATSILLVYSLAPLPISSLSAATRPGEPADKTASIKERVLRLPAGTPVEVAFVDTAKPKVTGMLGQVRDEGFDVKRPGLEPHSISFADVKSIKNKRGMGIKKPLIITAVIVAALTVAAMVSYVTGSQS